MSGSWVTYYDKELKYLVCFLKAFPESISTGEAHNLTVTYLIRRRWSTPAAPKPLSATPWRYLSGPDVPLPAKQFSYYPNLTSTFGCHYSGIWSSFGCQMQMLHLHLISLHSGRWLGGTPDGECTGGAMADVVPRRRSTLMQPNELLLADKLVEGADAIRSLGDWSEDVVVDARSGRKATKKTWGGEAEKLVF
ncbi:hypothetical protein B0H10DRAFT_1957500 [Mycena sp. CBHHK59/15]|nr:hypothetical protein B0H10DRAFT_1957500 [Mycena sp. CBHHK59/15]